MERYDVVVVGGGLAGLTAAAAAAAEGSRVLLIEGQRPGGRARTTRRDDGIAFNEGAHALSRGGEAWRVLSSLGITPTGGVPGTNEARVVRDGELHRLPSGAGSLLRTTLLGARSKAQIGKLLARLGRVEAADVAGRSVNAWLDDLGLAADARGFLAAMVRVATYAADHDRLPAEVAVTQLRLAVGDGVLYLDDGFGQLVEGVSRVARRRGVAELDHAAVASVTATEGGWTVRASDGHAWASPAVVLAAGGPGACAAVLPETPAGWAAVGPDVVAACLEVATTKRPTPPVLFGIDEPLYLSEHCPPARLAPPGIGIVEVARYRSTGEAGDPARDRAELEQHLGRTGIGAGDIVHSRYLHRMTVVHGVPDPAVGLAGRPGVAVPDADGLFVAGDWVGPAGWLADASFASGEAAGLLAAARAGAVQTALAR